MTSPTDVNPEAKWSEIWLLFDNGKYSVISGVYQGDSRRRLAQRWNGPMPDHPDRLLGFPINEKGRADWCLAPEFLEISILHALLHELFENPGRQTLSAGRKRHDLVSEEIKNFHKFRKEKDAAR